MNKNTNLDILEKRSEYLKMYNYDELEAELPSTPLNPQMNVASSRIFSLNAYVNGIKEITSAINKVPTQQIKE